MAEQAQAAKDRAERAKQGMAFDEAPKPLPPDLEPVAEFQIDFLPEAIGPWAFDIAYRMQCPIDYVGVV